MQTTVTITTFAIAGNPNSGKTTLFNRLTGLRQKVANYPGVTVEKKLGTLSYQGREIQLLDLPGTYALSSNSEEEKIASDIIQGIRSDVPPLDGVLCIVDSTCLERSLYLILQILDLKIPTAVLLNMSDELTRRGAEIDIPVLSKLLGVPVLAISATKGTGLPDLTQFLINWKGGEGVKSQHATFNMDDVACCDLTPSPSPPEPAIVLRRKRAKEICREVFRKAIQPHPISDKIDLFVMHKVWGPLIFSAVVIIVFQAVFSWAKPLMDFIDWGFSRTSEAVKAALPQGLIASFLADAVIAGVGSVVVFLPQILIVFFFIAMLEHSGYMARAATVMDRFFERLGLQGKSFLPLISSYACAIPGIMATRTIENRHDRLATILIAPLMTCSARLPVYALLIAAFVPNIPVIRGVVGLQALTLLGLYLVGFAAAMLTAFILKSSVLKSSKLPFLLDIPPYRFPSLKTILLLMWDRSKIFLKRASTLILLTSMVMWFLMSFPRTNEPNQIERSYAGRIGKFIEPMIEPLGFNWKIGVGLLAAQSAREVIISTLSTLYRIEAQDEMGQNQNLQGALKSDLTPLGAVSLMMFFVFAMQCMSTIAIARRETGGWKIPVLMFVYMNAYAYVASLLVYQGGQFLGFH